MMLFEFPFLCGSIMIALFQSCGILLSLRQVVNKFANFWWMVAPSSLRRSIVMLSGPGALPCFIVLIACSISLFVIHGKLSMSCS